MTMLHRESRLGYRTVSRPNGLVVPINVFDGEFFPDKAQQIEWLDCQKYWIVGDGFIKTERYVEFQDLLRAWSRDMARVIQGAPPWQDGWMGDDWFNVPDDELMPKPAANFEFAGLE